LIVGAEVGQGEREGLKKLARVWSRGLKLCQLRGEISRVGAVEDRIGELAPSDVARERPPERQQQDRDLDPGMHQRGQRVKAPREVVVQGEDER